MCWHARIIVLLRYSFVVVCSSCNGGHEKRFSELTEADFEHVSDTSGGDSIYYKVATVANTGQEVRPLNDEERSFLDACLAGADTMLREHFEHTDLTNFSCHALDELISRWHDDSAQFHCSREHFADCIGAAFGEFLARTYRMQHVIITDENGTDHATVLPALQITNYPINSVHKAIEQEREGSLAVIAAVNKREIAERSGGR